MFIFSWVVGKLGSWLWPVIGLAALGLSLALGVQTKRLSWAKAETQQVRDAWTLDTAQRTAVALDAATKYLAHSQALQDQVKAEQHAYIELEKHGAERLAKALATSSAALADNARMRGDLAAYAAGGGAAGGDTAAAASQRAAALGLLLAEAFRLDDEALLVAAESAGAAESGGNAVRALLAAWPK